MLFSQTFLIFDNFDNFKDYLSIVCRLSLGLDLSNVFLMVRVGLWVSKKTTEVKYHFHHIIPKAFAMNKASKLLTIKLFFLPLFA